MESKEKGGEEREATPQSAAAASSPYTGEPRGKSVSAACCLSEGRSSGGV